MLTAALATVPEHVRASWEQQAESFARMQRLSAEPLVPIELDVEELAQLEAMFGNILEGMARAAEEHADEPRR